ncbi:hypothetical protein OC834_001427 [Tilletia horrida]|nr:hypothetical protein OC834_001427 [Tilletia horrida]
MPSYYQPPPSSVSATTSTEAGDVAQLTYEPIDEAAVLKAVRDPGAGATCLFVGTTRDSFHGRAVSRLEYEAYTALAIKTLHDILLRARADPTPSISTITNPATKAHCCAPPAAAGGSSSTTNPSDSIKTASSSESAAAPTTSASASLPPTSQITRLHIVHRLGVVPVAEPSIAIACSSPHRRESFAVAEWALEEVKRVVQIWKREVYADGSVAVARDGEAAGAGLDSAATGAGDTLKSRIQDPKRDVRFPGGKGMSRGLYQGIGPVLVASLPAAGAFFTTYESVKRVLAHPSSPLSNKNASGVHSALGAAPMHLVASSVGELVSCAILTPAEILKQRAQVVNKALEGQSQSSGSSGAGKPRHGATLAHLRQLEISPTPPSTSSHPTHAKWSPYAPGDPAQGPSHRVKHPESGAHSAPHSQAIKPTPPRSAAATSKEALSSAATYASESARSLRGSYLRGFLSLAGRNLPFTAIQFPIYEHFRARLGQAVGLKAYTSPEDGSVILKKQEDSVLGDGSLAHIVQGVKDRLPSSISGSQAGQQNALTASDIGKTFLVAGGSAAGAGAIAALLTMPIDVAKTNIMLDGSSGPKSGVLATMGNIYAKEGAAGLLRGGLLRTIWTAVGAGLYLGSYESGRQWWNNRS